MIRKCPIITNPENNNVNLCSRLFTTLNNTCNRCASVSLSSKCPATAGMYFITNGIINAPNTATSINGACQLNILERYKAKGTPTVDAIANELITAPMATPLLS